MLGDAISTQNEKAGIRKSSDQLASAQKQAYAEQLAGLEQLRAMYPNDQQIQAEYDQARQAFEGFDARVNMGEFDQSGYSADKYLDPYLQYESDQAQRALQSSQAGAGGLYSGKAMLELQQNAQNYAGRNLAQARAEAMQQKQFDYQDYLNHFQNLKQNALLEQERLSNVFQNRAGQRSDVQSLIGKRADLTSSNTMALGDIQANRTRALYGADSQMYNRLGNALGSMASTAIGSFSGSAPNMQLAQGVDPYAGVQNQFDQMNQGSLDAIKSANDAFKEF